MNKIWHCDGLNIIQLLSEYSRALSYQTDGKLDGQCDVEFISNDIYYKYYIKGGLFKVKLFEFITLTNENIKFTTIYLKTSNTIIIKENELESNIDTIIQSDDMGKYINYLLRVAR